MIKSKIKIYCNCCGKNQKIDLITQFTGKHAITCTRGHVIGEYTEYTLKKVNIINGINMKELSRSRQIL